MNSSLQGWVRRMEITTYTLGMTLISTYLRKEKTNITV